MPSELSRLVEIDFIKHAVQEMSSRISRELCQFRTEIIQNGNRSPLGAACALIDIPSEHKCLILTNCLPIQLKDRTYRRCLFRPGIRLQRVEQFGNLIPLGARKVNVCPCFLRIREL